MAATGRDADRSLQLVWGPLGALRGLLGRPLASYYLLLSSVALLVAIGLVMVFSATSVEALGSEGNAFGPVAQQMTWAGLGLVLFWVAQRLPLATYQAVGYPLLIASFLLLALLALFPDAQLGPVRTIEGIWMETAGLHVQPSEISKVALVLWGAQVLTRKGRHIVRFGELAIPLFPVAGLLLMLVGIADLGTMLCLLLVFLSLLYVAGVRFRIFAAILGLGLGGVILLIAARPYRLTRLISFLDPGGDPMSTDYQPVQGMYAIATGGWFGVGLGESRQKWGYLPERHNDFIFAIIAEELGVIGCLVVLSLLAVFAYSGLRIARRVTDPFARAVAASCTIWLVGQALINIGAVVGLLPVTGLPLPFISAGGSALVAAMAMVGMLASFARAEPAAARALHARPPRRWVRIVWVPLPPKPGSRARSVAQSRSAVASSRSVGSSKPVGGPRSATRTRLDRRSRSDRRVKPGTVRSSGNRQHPT
ncbi:MAG TPA: putative lipid II flippase FtsW [Micromonosporaceae bacterium]|nr:putative lipid II flippase FtsW [Micromonosporaceae bacterium]